MKTRNYITPPLNCTGCALCANVCSQNAVRMVWNDEGFLVPHVDTEVCVNCGRCVKMCPAQPGEKRAEEYVADFDSVIAYGGWNANREILQKSSSGGVFTALAEKVFSVGGCVFGVVWKDKFTAEFAMAETPEQLAPMRGSKYVQAEPGIVYRKVKAELEKGREVLFSGTACQIHALKKYLRKTYENLLTFDIVCHGVPSRKLLQAYVKYYEQLHGREVKDIYFRFKDDNWQRYKVQKRFIDGFALNDRHAQDMFMGLFIGDKMLNRACYDCPHAHLPRPGDLTLGDFWGDLHTLHPDWPIEKGIGSLIANTKKGQTILELLATEGKIILHRESFWNLYNGQPRSYRREEAHVPVSREEALMRIGRENIIDVWNSYCNTTKIGVLRLRKNGCLYRCISFFCRALRYLKRKLCK